MTSCRKKVANFAASAKDCFTNLTGIDPPLVRYGSSGSALSKFVFESIKIIEPPKYLGFLYEAKKRNPARIAALLKLSS